MRLFSVKRRLLLSRSVLEHLLAWSLLAVALHFSSVELNTLFAQAAPATQPAREQIQPEQLRRALEPMAEAHAGEVAVSVRVMDDNNEVVCHWQYHGQRVMPTASLIKLPVMLEAYRQAQAGEIDLNDMLTLTAEDQVPGAGILTDHFSPGLKLSLRDAVRLMIRYSDNTATNLVVDHIGLPSTAQTMAKLGWPETQLHSKVFRRDTSIALDRSERYGLGSTRADDMTDLLVRLEQGKLVSPEASQAMLEHLLSCDDSAKLPRDLPKGFTVAHKTGSVNRSRTAAGVVSGTGIKFAICVLTDKNEDASWSDDNAAHLLIGSMARAVVDLLQQQAAATAAERSAVTDSTEADSADSNSTELQTLELGATGALVETLQRTLNARIAAGLGVDGDFGSMTEDAVKKFQLAHNLAASGIVDPPTWAALGTLITQDELVATPDEVNAESLPKSPPLDPHAPPEVTATAWASVDMASGRVLGGKELHQRLHFASTTKVMTALLVAEMASRDPAVLDEVIEFSERADNTLGSTSGVRAGERLPVRELLYGLLLPSGNDAAVALAEHFGSRLVSVADAQQQPAEGAPAESRTTELAYDQFIEAMNRRAGELGMADTHFINPHGLPDDRHLSTAADLAILARAAWQLPLMREIVQTRLRGAQVHGSDDSTRNLRWVNTNRLLAQQGFLGMKTGTTTAAGACLIAVGTPEQSQSETIVVVLGSNSSTARYVDARNIFAWTWRLP